MIRLSASPIWKPADPYLVHAGRATAAPLGLEKRDRFPARLDIAEAFRTGRAVVVLPLEKHATREAPCTLSGVARLRGSLPRRQLVDADVDLSVEIGPLRLKNPILLASGTCGYAVEMAPTVPLHEVGAVIPKTVTLSPRRGNPPPRTVETPAGLLNSIGLDNDGIDRFLEVYLPKLGALGTAVIVNVAGKNVQEFASLCARLDQAKEVAAIELNLSCPNVSGGIDFAVEPSCTRAVVGACRQTTRLPLIAKLTPNVTDMCHIAQAACDAGADAVSLVNTYIGMAVDWRARRPVLGGGTGGLSGPAIKPLALRWVWQVSRAISKPVVGIGGISTIDDVMEFLVTGATAVQVGTANFYDPGVGPRLVRQLPAALRELGARSVREVVGTIRQPGA